MFIGGPRRPMPPNQRMPMQHRRVMQGKQAYGKPNLLSMFQTPDGSLDFEKISTTVQQINKIYNQVSPMITRFVKK